MQNFSIGALWGQAWNAFKRNWLSGVAIFILWMLLSLIPILGSLIILFLSAVWAQWGLRAVRSDTPISFGEAFPRSAATYLKVMIALIIGGFIVALGPGIVFAIGFVEPSFFDTYLSRALIVLAVVLAVFLALFFITQPYWVVDRDEGILGSIKKSFALSSRNFWKITLFFLSVLGINLLGALPCFLGLFVTAPTTQAAYAALYLALSENMEGDSPKLA